jgi:hypothetical protein
VICAVGTIRGVIVELPLVTAAEIAAEYRPGGRETVKATLRRLRERGVVSAGVAERPRGRWTDESLACGICIRR